MNPCWLVGVCVYHSWLAVQVLSDIWFLVSFFVRWTIPSASALHGTGFQIQIMTFKVNLGNRDFKWLYLKCIGSWFFFCSSNSSISVVYYKCLCKSKCRLRCDCSSQVSLLLHLLPIYVCILWSNFHWFNCMVFLPTYATGILPAVSYFSAPCPLCICLLNCGDVCK